MAKKKPEEAPKGSPAWMATFSDLMNLLLCFFVLLFSMSTVDAEKFKMVVASMQSSFSILPSGGASIGDGQMVSAGVRQLEFLDTYYQEAANSASQDESEDSAEEEFKAQELAESEKIADEIESQLATYGLQDLVEVEFNAEYVQLNLSGAILFSPGKADILEEAYPIVDKISLILSGYPENIIGIEGHTDNVPLDPSNKYENNDVLSMFRALNVANYVKGQTDLNPAYIQFAGRGEYVPIADNSTPEGRARNRRVEIKIYNSYNSNIY